MKAPSTIARFGMYLAGFMAVVNISVIYMALPSIERSLHAGIADQEWILSIYPLMEGGFTLACGTLGDLYGRKRILTITTWLFVLATLGCALAPTAPLLIIARGVQGLGGAALLSLPVAILIQMLPDPEDNEDAIKAFSTVAGLGAVAGPVIGGVLVHWFGWPAIFYLSVIMGLAVLATFPYATESERDPSLRLDGAGQFLAILSFLAISFALIEGNANGWASPIIIAAFAVFAAGLALFIAVERRVKQPMVHLRYFKEPPFNVSLAVIGILNFGWYGLMLLCTLFLQNVQHQSAIEAGFYLMPSNVAFFIANQYSSALEKRIGQRAMLAISFAVSLAGIAWLAVLGVHSGSWQVAGALFVAGIGWGLIFTPASSMGMAAVTEKDEGFGSGAIALSRSLFGVFGIAVLGSLLAAGIAHAAGPRVYHHVASTALSVPASQAFVDGMHLAVAVCFGLTLLFGLAVTPLTPAKKAAPQRATAL